MQDNVQGQDTSSRDASIDVAKGIAILLVIVGHIQQTPLPLKVWLYTFHMPLFFLCSGMVFSLRRHPSFSSFAKSRLRSLVWPYFWLCVALWFLTRVHAMVLLKVFGEGEGPVWDPLGCLLAILLGHRLHHYYFSMWFLTCLFCAELAFYAVVKSCKTRWQPYVALGVAGVLAQLPLMHAVGGQYWSIDLVPIALAFVSFGYILRNSGLSKDRYCKLRMLPLALAVNVVCGYCNYRLGGFPDLFNCNMGDPVLYLLSATSGCWAALIVSQYLSKSQLLSYLGRNTLTIYAFQNSLFIPIATDVVLLVGKLVPILVPEGARWILITALTVLMSVLMVEVVNRYFPWMLGHFAAKGAHGVDGAGNVSAKNHLA